MRALLSVYDKTGIEDFARGLSELGVELVASGGTSAALTAAGIRHTTVEEVTGSPEMLSGRVKTVHPRIHGGILADLDQESHRDDLARLGIEPIGLVVSNLYPFRADPSVEMIDIGGPAMLRAAAKNHARVTAVVDPAEYPGILQELRAHGQVSAATRTRLARAAFAHTAAYDEAIVAWLDASDRKDHGDEASALPRQLQVVLERVDVLRYGENPHQQAARYRDVASSGGWWDGAVQHGGRELSYLNVFDADAAWRLVHEVASLGLAAASAVIVKHANPSGVAVASSIAEAYAKAFDADPLSAFGGIVALSEPVDGEMARQIVDNPLADVLVGPSFDDEALALFAERRRNMRSLSAGSPGPQGLMLRPIDGGYLAQGPDVVSDRSAWRVATKAVPTEEQWRDAALAWLVCARTSSNAIVLARDGVAVGIGCGQQSRVDAAGIAARKAAGRAEGGAGASDAFFPFRDGLDAVADSGVGVVVQPGGSVRDDEIIAAADEREVAMVLTGERHFRH